MKARAAMVLVGLVVILGTVLATKSSNKPYSSQIVDVSWPNCTTKTTDYYAYGIVGVNGGLDFRSNPCLNQETQWFTRYDLYINTGYPGDARGLKYQSSPKLCQITDSPCLAYNYGYNAALYSIHYADLQNAHAARWWLDVESDNSWSNNSLVNRQDLLGALAAIRQNVPFATEGFYSYPGQWNNITNKWRIGLPAWVATGSLSAKVAAAACQAQSFTGGVVQLTQYTAGLDVNIACLIS